MRSLFQPVRQQLERGAPPARHFPRVDNLVVGPRRRPARQRHRLPGLVVAAARRCAPAAALHRSDGRAEAAPAGQDRSTISARRRASTTRRRPSSISPTSWPGDPGSRRLPFPVHVVERVETYDRISRNRFVTRYAYHHGYFDGVEREFRGFGMVEQWDTEEFAALSAERAASRPATNVDAAVPRAARAHAHLVPHRRLSRPRPRLELLRRPAGCRRHGRVLPRAGPDRRRRRSDLLLDDTVLPAGLTRGRRARGLPRAQGLDAAPGGLRARRHGARQQHPYTVTEQNFTIRRAAARGGQPPRACSSPTPARPSATTTSAIPADPRVSHALTLEVDDFGNVLKSAAIGYGRRQPDPALSRGRSGQAERDFCITYTENGFTNRDRRWTTPTARRCRARARTYELTGSRAGRDRRSRFHASTRYWPHDSRGGIGSATICRTSRPPTAGLAAETADRARAHPVPPRTIWADATIRSTAAARRAGIAGACPARATSWPSRRGSSPKSTADSVTDAHARRPKAATSTATATRTGGFPRGGSSSRRAPHDDPATELAHAREHFFLPHRFRDPFHTDAVEHRELRRLRRLRPAGHVETRDALGNRRCTATATTTACCSRA